MELEAASTSEVAQAAPLSEQQLWKPDGLLSRDVVVLPHVANLLSANPALGDILRRAEFWSNETATLLEVLNVLGRWQTADQIKERSLFTPEDMNPREENIFQSATKRRYEMAQRLGSCERMGLIQNAKGLPFTDEKLAASVGLTVDDFTEIPVTDAACNVVYDALAESRSGLIPYDVTDKRRASWIKEDGSFDVTLFKIGTIKSTFVVTCSWFMFGKGNFVWILLIARGLADAAPDKFSFLNPASPEGKALWKAFAIL
uniref:Uncharacterized protein n=1 Tax=Haptolina ericina TaxID=156174 RepID=A0A7S3FJE6_9EUKA